MLQVSVIVSVYNAEFYLEHCLDTLLEQTLREIEIICVDDGSEDSSFSILQRYAQKDARVIILRQENKGAGCARNYGMKYARGKYVIFLDSDDYFSLTLLEKTVERAEQTNSDIVIFRAAAFNDNTEGIFPLNDQIQNYPMFFSEPFTMEDIPNEIFNSFMVVAWNKLYRKKFLTDSKLFFQKIKRSNDLCFTCKTLVEAKRIILIDEVLLYYRMGNGGSLQETNAETPLDFYKALSALKEYLMEMDYYFLTERSYVQLVLEIIFYNLNKIKNPDKQAMVIYFLQQEGLENLGIKTVRSGIDLPFLIRSQYIVLKSQMISNKIWLLRCLYCVRKAWEYYLLCGAKGVMERITRSFT